MWVYLACCQDVSHAPSLKQKTIYIFTVQPQQKENIQKTYNVARSVIEHLIVQQARV